MAEEFALQPEGILMLRESRLFLMLRIFFLEIAVGVVHVFFRFLFSATGLLALNIAEGISFYVLYILFLQILNALLIVYVLFRWMNKYYIVNLKEVSIHDGVFRKKEANYSLATVDHITLNQGIFARLLNFGTVRLFDSTNQQHINLMGIHNPNYYLQIITKIRNTAASGPPQGI